MIAQGQSLQAVFDYANNGYSIQTNISEIDDLLNRGGVQSMMWTISLVLIALAFGGALEATGCLKSIINSIKTTATTFARTQVAAVGTAFSTNLVAGDPYLSVALPGRMFSPVYRGMGYSTLNLSRGVEEGGDANVTSYSLERWWRICHIGAWVGRIWRQSGKFTVYPFGVCLLDRADYRDNLRLP